jgi:hypothetical protein
MNTLAYLASSSATKEKSFVTLTLGVSLIELFLVTGKEGKEAKLARVFVLGMVERTFVEADRQA